MKTLTILSLILTMLAFASCKKDDAGTVISEGDYLVFGHFYGLCQGEKCIETYKLTDDKLYEDLTDDYARAKPFNFQELVAAKYDTVKSLASFFPAELLDEKENVIGCPDCSDGGGIFIQYLKDGEVKSWKIDKFRSNVPTYLLDFMDEVEKHIELLSR